MSRKGSPSSSVAMRVAVLVIGAGCGRFGFDSAADGRDGGSMTSDGATSDGSMTGEDTAAASCELPAGAVVHLRFDEGSGSSTADSSGTGNDAQLIGMDDSDWVSGRLGGALDFDGTDDRVNAGSAPAIDDVVPLSMCAWIRPRSYASEFPTLADKSIDSFTGGWFFYIEDNAQFGFQTNQRKWITGGTITLGAWTHVCISWDGSNGFAGIRLVQDGVTVPMKNSGSNGNQLDSDASRDLLVGRVNNGTFPFDGVIDDFILYDRVLTAQEFAGIHACGGS